MESLEILRREHRMVLRVAHAARDDVDRALACGEIDIREADELLDFFRYFTNSCHSPKEEDLLYTMLHRRGLAWDEPPLRDLVRQHEEMRVVLDSAFDWLPRVRAGDPGALDALLLNLTTYLELLELHVAEEEDVLFAIARQRLRPQDLDDLGEAFAAIACEEQQEGVHEYYAGVARHLAGAAA